MAGPSLIDTGELIQGLASEDSDYYVVCGRIGDRPGTADGNRFPDWATARAAARATEKYRSALRRYDPPLPNTTRPPGRKRGRRSESAASHLTRDSARQLLSDSVLDANAVSERCDLVGFCHPVAGAVFETLFGEGYGVAGGVNSPTG